MAANQIDINIDHEVRLRINEKKYEDLQKQVNKIISMLHWLLGITVSSIVIPVVLHHYGLV